MSLSVYTKKRSFEQTPEPVGGKATADELRFVVQKHAASHLHYDFRLEMQGVLKSWAVPKGPSMDPDIKRLAMMVEDHPYDYRTFEGIIPKGNYGAGTVIVWDEGTYESTEIERSEKNKQEKNLLQQLYSGKIKFRLYGKKLKGEFALIKSSGSEENSWILRKLEDKYISTEDITKKDKSVQSNLTLEQVAKTSNHIYQSNRKNVAEKKAATKKSTTTIVEEEVQNAQQDVTKLLKKGKKAAFPENIKPMLASLTGKAFDDVNWIFEIKWDGYRSLAYLQKGNVDIRSRANLSYNEKFNSIATALAEWKVDAVVDGEIIAINEEGSADFQALQGFAKTGKKANLVYYVFDLLWYKGTDLTQLPLTERKALLNSILPQENSVIKYSDDIACEGKAFFEVALSRGLEGIMAKKADSIYTFGHRTKSWLKIKNNQQTEAIICGFTKGRNSRKYFGAIILGKYEGDKLMYIGHSGSGIDEKGLQELYEKFKPLITAVCPFGIKPKTNMPVTWLKPELVCEVKFTEWTDEKSLRHPIFLGLREDKTAQNEKGEAVVSPPSKSQNKKSSSLESKATAQLQEIDIAPAVSATTKTLTAKAKKGARKVLISGEDKETVVTINKQKLKLTNLDKFYWPHEKITKRDVLNYYYQISPYMFPYMKDRPQSLNRHPNGINGKNFYQKNVEGKVADWINTYPYSSDSDGQTKEFLVCTDEATLLYIASLGCIEMNPWHSRIQSPDNPDWCVIDLDPDDNPFDQVIETACVVKEILDTYNIPAYCKTSGATGMHIYIPLEAKYTYAQSKLFAQLIVGIVHRELQFFTSLERSPAKRKGKIYLDFLQNRSIQTIAAPYSIRPKPGATVSTPLHWEEVKKGLTPKQFTIHNILDRLKNEGDLFKPVLGKGINLQQILEKMSSST